MEKYDNLTEIIANNLIYYRNKAKYTQKELAEKLNYSDKSISKWERKESVPDIFVLNQLAKLYGLSVNDFLTTKKKERVSNWFISKSLITLIAIALVWLLATLAFFIIEFFFASSTSNFQSWLVFIYAIPVSAIVMTIFNKIYFTRLLNFISVSILCWTIALSLFLSFPTVENIQLVFIVAIPIEVIIVFYYLLLLKRRKR